jgi:signal transduction histidine kinase
MSGTASLLRRHWLEGFWAVWVVVNAIAILNTPATTIPYHNIWLSLAIVYGFRMWRVRTALILLVVIATVSGAALVYGLDGQNLDEAAEIPMMSALFLIMVWFVARRQAAIDDLGRASARERDFVRDASHQLRTPITVARGHAELIRETGDPMAADDAEIVIGEMDRLSRISDRLLMQFSIEEAQIVARLPVDLANLLDAAARRWEATAPRQWRVRIDTSGTLLADETQIETALDALIENAIKATGPGDRIEIRLRSEADVAVMEISDTGIGIDPRNVDRVFDRFWRADPPGAHRNGGTGLGLSMVRAIAEAHEGSAEALLRPHGGTTFRMRLPGFTRARDVVLG